MFQGGNMLDATLTSHRGWLSILLAMSQISMNAEKGLIIGAEISLLSVITEGAGLTV